MSNQYTAQIDRLTAYVREVTKPRYGIDKEVIHSMNGVELRMSDLRTLLTAPEGYALVPRQPTHDIRKAMHHAYWQTPHLPYHDGSPKLWNDTYTAMIEAAEVKAP
jgi:hypothetical protein